MWDFSWNKRSSAGQGIGSWAAIILLVAVVAKRIKHREWIMLILVLLALAAVTVGNLLELGGPPLLVSWIVGVIVLASVVIWRGYDGARDRRVARKNAQVLDDIAMKLGAKEAEPTITDLLAELGNPKEPVQAVKTIAAERAALSTFLTVTRLDADLVKAAADLAAERAQHAEADRKAAADLTSLRRALKETIDDAALDQSNLDAALNAANSRIFDLEAASRQPAVDKQVAADDAKRFWTADQSVRVFASPIVPGGGNHSCILPKKDGSAKMRLRFLVINMSPFDVRVTNIKFNFSATMDAFQLSGGYNGPPGEQPDSVVRLAPWRQQHFVVRVKGSLANVANLSNKSTRIACLYLHDNCYVTVRGHWDTPERAPLMSDANYMLVSWEEFR